MKSKKMKNRAMKKVSIGDLIANADKFKSKKEETKELYVASLDAVITIKKPSRDIILDSYEMDPGEANLFLVYECVIEPNFKDAKLQEAFEVTGYEVLDKIFDSGEIDSISKQIIEFAGYGTNSVSIVEDLKN